MAEGDEVALKLGWTHVDVMVQHVAEITCETFLITLLGILEIADRLVVEEHREHRAHVVHLDALAFYYLLKTGEEAVAALFEEFVNTRFAQLLQGFITGCHCYRVTTQGACLINWAFWCQNTGLGNAHVAPGQQAHNNHSGQRYKLNNRLLGVIVHSSILTVSAGDVALKREARMSRDSDRY